MDILFINFLWRFKKKILKSKKSDAATLFLLSVLIHSKVAMVDKFLIGCAIILTLSSSNIVMLAIFITNRFFQRQTLKFAISINVFFLIILMFKKIL